MKKASIICLTILLLVSSLVRMLHHGLDTAGRWGAEN